MNDVTFELDPSGKGAFLIQEGSERLAEMIISIEGNRLTVFHTEVSEKLRGQGIAATLLAAMVAYAREHRLSVVPLCPYVSAQFRRHPELYSDVWNADWHNKS